MKRVVAGFVVLGMAALSGCSTVRSSSGSSLENRVQNIENRLQVVEADLQSSTGGGAMSTGITSTSSGFDKAATVETMTKIQIQKALESAGYYDGPIDGKIGPKTRDAIMQFQKDMGLEADGVAGRKTKEKLLKYLG
jgi:murein L,D-transpeptidase YcbB/YkuD